MEMFYPVLLLLLMLPGGVQGIKVSVLVDMLVHSLTGPDVDRVVWLKLQAISTIIFQILQSGLHFPTYQEYMDI